MQQRIAFVGEAWGADEERASRLAKSPRPFVGGAGRLFNAMLASIAIKREVVRRPNGGVDIDQPPNILVTNVFNRHPPANKIEALFVPRKGGDPDWPMLARGKYLDPALRPELERLFAELRRFRPAVIVALGNTPLWALCKVAGVMQRRGCWHIWQDGKTQIPVIPTVHPAYILRKYVWFPLAISDLKKAQGIADGTLKLEKFKFIGRPTMADVRKLLALKGPIVFDIETLPTLRAITCVGIGDAALKICVPFVDMNAAGRNYWPTAEAEAEAWRVVRRVLENPATVKVAQVATYDITWLREIAGIEVKGPLWDTRLLHHALWPELPHSLEAIATSFPDVLLPPWKALYRAGKADADA